MKDAPYFDQFDKFPRRIITEAFGAMRTIDQKDIVLPNGNVIDMSFFREVGFPVHQNWIMKDWNINFNIIRDFLPTVEEILSRKSLELSIPAVKTQINYFLPSLCVDFYSRVIENQKVYSCGFTCIDLNAGGTVVCIYISAAKQLNSMSEILFVNSSFEQYMNTLALYIIHQNEMGPSISLEEFVRRNTLFEQYVQKIDPMALPGGQTETFWSRVIQLLRSEEFAL
ncbi:MAG: hypothetical protein Q4G69_10600 [Planctomycetia bacterium]|nr:hypothetical protein [Planctomycetia bacterium]